MKLFGRVFFGPFYPTPVHENVYPKIMVDTLNQTVREQEIEIGRLQQEVDDLTTELNAAKWKHTLAQENPS